MLRTVVTAELRSGLALLSDEEIEAEAQSLWSGVSSVADVEDLARARGIAIEHDDGLPAGCDGLALEHAVVVRPSRSRALLVLRILHELAHHLLGARVHTHADVWRMTLALAWPVERIRHGLPPLDIPPWCLALRAAILAECRVIPAA